MWCRLLLRPLGWANNFGSRVGPTSVVRFQNDRLRLQSQWSQLRSLSHWRSRFGSRLRWLRQKQFRPTTLPTTEKLRIAITKTGKLLVFIFSLSFTFKFRSELLMIRISLALRCRRESTVIKHAPIKISRSHRIFIFSGWRFKLSDLNAEAKLKKYSVYVLLDLKQLWI